MNSPEIKFEYIRNVNLPEQVLTLAYITEERMKNGVRHTLYSFGCSVNKIQKEKNQYGRWGFVGDHFVKRTGREIAKKKLLEVKTFQIAVPWEPQHSEAFDSDPKSPTGWRIQDHYFDLAYRQALEFIAWGADVNIHPDAKVITAVSAIEIAQSESAFLDCTR